MTTVPSQYQAYVNQAASATGLPASVVAAQANEESGFNPSAVSPAGAEGFWQFMPSTYDAYASQAGVSTGTEFNVADETKVYGVYMNALLKQEGGSVFKALEAYNAGPGNLAAGAGYANTIMAAAGQSNSLSSSGGGGTTAASTTSFPGGSLDPLNWPGMASSAVNNTINGYVNSIGGAVMNDLFKTLGIPSFKDLLQRLGLILLGAVLLVVGLVMLSKESGVQQTVKTVGKVAAVGLCRTGLRVTGADRFVLSMRLPARCTRNTQVKKKPRDKLG